MRVSRSGSKYAAGSSASWGLYDNRICCICGRPIRITTQNAQMHHEAGEHRSAHRECGSPLKPRNVHDSETSTQGAQPMLDTPEDTTGSQNIQAPDTPEPEPTPDPEPDDDEDEDVEQ